MKTQIKSCTWNTKVTCETCKVDKLVLTNYAMNIYRTSILNSYLYVVLKVSCLFGNICFVIKSSTISIVWSWPINVQICNKCILFICYLKMWFSDSLIKKNTYYVVESGCRKNVLLEKLWEWNNNDLLPQWFLYFSLNCYICNHHRTRQTSFIDYQKNLRSYMKS